MRATEKPRIFISYAHTDREHRKMLEYHLSVLDREGELAIWSDREIVAGEDWEGEISWEFNSADVVLMLLSPDFLASAYLNDVESERAIERAEAGDLALIPIVIRPCAWEKTDLSRFQVLPRRGRPITSWKNTDEAWLEVSRGIRVALQDASNRQSFFRKPEQHPSEAPTVPQGTPIGRIFRTAGPPDITYVVPEDFLRLRAEVSLLGKGLVVEGPSGIGKTTAVKKALSAEGITGGISWIRGSDRKQVSGLGKLLDPSNSGVLVIDDFHHLEQGIQGQAAASMKAVADDEPPSSKIIVIGISKVGFSLMAEFPELAGRVANISMGKQPDEKVMELISLGEEAANIRLGTRRDIVELSAGSFFTAQLICYHIALKAGVNKRSMGLTRVAFGPGDVIEKVLEELEFKYREPLHTFASYDSGQVIPGGSLILLWLIREQEAGYVRLDEAAKQYPQFSETFQWLGSENLDACLDSDKKLRSLFHYDENARILAIDDPRLEFYLKNIKWSDFAHKAGHTVSITSGQRLEFEAVGREVPSNANSLAPEEDVSDVDIKERTTTNSYSSNWWRTALLAGGIAGLSAIVFQLLPQHWQVVRIGLLVAVAVAIVVALRNPKTRYMQAFWAVFSVFGAAHSLPALGIEGLSSEFWVRITTDGPGATFNLVTGAVLLTLLILDHFERRENH